MLTTRWGAVLVGAGGGLLALAAAALLAWLVLSAAGSAEPVGPATVVGTMTGFAAGGALAGRRAGIRHWFHGAMAALVVAAAVTLTALRGGSPAPMSQVLLLAAFAISVGGGAGALARRRTRQD